MSAVAISVATADRRVIWRGWDQWRRGQARPEEVRLETAKRPCPYCWGQGWVIEVSSYSAQVVIAMQPQAIPWRILCPTCEGAREVDAETRAVLA